MSDSSAAGAAIEILKTARELIAKPGGWTQGAYARRANGSDAEWAAGDAICFCAEGAILRAASTVPKMKAARHVLRCVLSGSPDFATIPRWNDAPERTQAEVVAAFDAAISLATPTTREDT